MGSGCYEYSVRGGAHAIDSAHGNVDAVLVRARGLCARVPDLQTSISRKIFFIGDLVESRTATFGMAHSLTCHQSSRKAAAQTRGLHRRQAF